MACQACNGEAKIYHTSGYKDSFLVQIAIGNETWNPTNQELFTLVDLWFQSEDHEFGGGYGRWMPFFYLGLIAIGQEQKAFEAYEKRGKDAVTHFEQCVDEHGDELIEHIENLQQ